MDALDPEGTTIHHRLYRPHCRPVECTYVKELRLLGRSMDKTIIVDNSPCCLVIIFDTNKFLISFTIIIFKENIISSPEIIPNPSQKRANLNQRLNQMGSRSHFRPKCPKESKEDPKSTAKSFPDPPKSKPGASKIEPGALQKAIFKGHLIEENPKGQSI